MSPSVRFGVDRLAVGRPFPLSARLGLLTNFACQTSDGRWTALAVREAGYTIAAFFGPEHGLTLSAPAGESVDHASLDGIPVVSLYGADRTAAEEAMASIDLLVIDLPDVGVRYYTYPWTVREALKMAAAHGKPVAVLDRPNPLGGEVIEGGLPDPGFDSPVCSARVPVRHGLTLGELARWHVQELRLDLDLEVIAVEGWRRDMLWPDLGLPWVPPSPALRSVNAAFLYPATCLIEGTNLSEGRGTDAPFEQFGAPFLNPAALAVRLGEEEDLEDVDIKQTWFEPSTSKWAGEVCLGLRLEVADPHFFFSVRAGLTIVSQLYQAPEFAFFPAQFDALAGTPTWRESIIAGRPVDTITAAWLKAELDFRTARQSVLLYS